MKVREKVKENLKLHRRTLLQICILVMFMSWVIINPAQLSASNTSIPACENNRPTNQIIDQVDEALRNAGLDPEEIRRTIESGRQDHEGDININVPRGQGNMIRITNSEQGQNITIRTNTFPGQGFLGVHSTDLTIPRARELGYPHLDHGVLITGTVANGPARRQGIRPDDIIMTINDVQILSHNHLGRVARSHDAGTTVNIKIFRNQEIIEIPIVLSATENRTSTNTPQITNVSNQNPNKETIGGVYMPLWFETDFRNIINGFEFGEWLTDGWSLYHGGGGKMHVGNGWYLGGMGAGFIRNNTSTAENVTTRTTFTSAFGGLTVDKRFTPGKRTVLSAGLLLGGGAHRIGIEKIDNNVEWGNLFNTKNMTIAADRAFIIAQPRFETLFKFNNWLGIRGEVGYLYGLPVNNGWRIYNELNSVSIKNSPNTPFEGMTISIGPWIGF